MENQIIKEKETNMKENNHEELDKNDYRVKIIATFEYVYHDIGSMEAAERIAKIICDDTYNRLNGNYDVEIVKIEEIK